MGPIDADREVAATFDALRAGGEPPAIQFRSLVSAQQYSHLYRLAAHYARPGERVLDWGCGNGHFSYHLARRGLEVSAFSFEDEPAILGRLSRDERERVEFVRGDPGDPVRLPFPDGHFDHVFSIGVLEHVREFEGDERESLAEIRRVTRPGGAFVCYHLPNRSSRIEAVARMIHPGPPPPQPHWPGYHRYRFTPSDIRTLCDAAGLSVVELRDYGALPRNPFTTLPGALRASRGFAAAIAACDRTLERRDRAVRPELLLRRARLRTAGRRAAFSAAARASVGPPSPRASRARSPRCGGSRA